MAAEAENLSDSQSEVSNACDELTSLESSISDSDLDNKNNNKRLQFFLICMLEREKPCLIGRVLVITRNSKKRGKTVQKKNCR